jgi:hypothetical protein
MAWRAATFELRCLTSLIRRVAYEAEAPPPTRGWTLCAAAVPRAWDGSPTHAGRDPCAYSQAQNSRRLPRPRGDGPIVLKVLRSRVSAPPPTRGWTPVRVDAVIARLGSPAHAGMDPHGWRDCPASAWLPRPRGDGPTHIGWRSLPSPRLPRPNRFVIGDAGDRRMRRLGHQHGGRQALQGRPAR